MKYKIRHRRPTVASNIDPVVVTILAIILLVIFFVIFYIIFQNPAL